MLFTHGEFGHVFAARRIGTPVFAGVHFALGTALISILGYEPLDPETPVIALRNGALAFFTRLPKEPAGGLLISDLAVNRNHDGQ